MDRICHDLDKARSKLYTTAKRLWLIGVGAKVLAAVAAIGASTGQYGGTWIVVSIAVAVLAEVAILTSEYVKSRAEGIARKIDFSHAFGWSITGTDIAELIAGLPRTTRKEIAATELSVYFSDESPAGAGHAMECLRESAFWSKDLASMMAKICWVLVCGLLLFSIVVPTWAIATAGSIDEIRQVPRIVGIALAMGITLGLAKLAIGFGTFSNRAKEVQDKADGFRAGSSPTDISALKLWMDYHLARASAPPIPDCVYNVRRDMLNELWKEYKDV